MSVDRILPSDKNTFHVYVPIKEDGTFYLRIPYADASRRQRKMTLKKLSTLKPFIPTDVKDLFDLTEVNQTSTQVMKGLKLPILKIEFDTTSLFDNSWPIINWDSLIADGLWSDSVECLKKYSGDEEANQTGLFINMKKITAEFDELKIQIDEKLSDFELENYTFVFAEIGTKVTESELSDKTAKKENMKLDLMHAYLFPNDFIYPRIVETRTDNDGVEINVGGTTTLTNDVNLRSMLEYTLVQINKGDVRSSVHGSKRSLYYEYDVEVDAETVTKYLWVWTIGNPMPFFDKDHAVVRKAPYYDLNSVYGDVTSKSFQKKEKNYGRNGTFLDFLGYKDRREPANDISYLYSYHVDNFFVDAGILFNTSAYTSSKENVLMNLMRPNSAIFMMAPLNEICNMYGAPVYGTGENWIMELYCGRNQINFPDGSTVFFSGVDTITFRDLPNFSVNYYGDDLLIKLLCRETETSCVSKGNEVSDLTVENILCVIKANENTYQQFLGNDNQLSIQPPQFRPLSFVEQASSLILRQSNSVLHFTFQNIKGDAVSFIPGDRVYLELEFEPLNDGSN